MAKCRDCGQEIQFIELNNGKYHPCDLEIARTDECEIGDKFVTESGELKTVTPFTQYEEGYPSHFNLCAKGEK